MRPDGSLVFRNHGWCGTPPLTYSNLDGTWLALNEDQLVFTHPLWSEPQNFLLTIVSLSDDELRCTLELIE